ncbi:MULTISPECIES: glycoside hydrolase family 97 catalytic domain-containing protein [unclassified Nocardioides]|uniref:glycoside hydrolase family 97 catalytic domain-containing protein n=1 Tax=unclassified Nocardioides TaxID=2615069 RepID=UPI003014CC77
MRLTRLVVPLVCSVLTLTGLGAGTASAAPVAAAPAVAADGSFPGDSVASPDGTLRATVGVVGGRLTYEVVRDGTTTVVAPSGLGFTLRQPALDLRTGLTVTSVERKEIDETWTPAWGTASRVRNHANELTVHTRHEASGALLDVVFRVFDDGVGFRYHFPQQAALGPQFVVSAEASEFALPADLTAYYLAAGTDWNADEKHYMTVPLPQVPTAQTPITTSRADGLFVTVHEADLTDYPSMTLKRDDAVAGKLVSELIALPGADKDKAVVPLGTTGFDTPWRTLTVGRQAGDLAVSHLVENLNDACAICDVDSDGDGVDDTTDWIEPATYTGVWWELQRRDTTWFSGPKHGATTARVKKYIDLAAEAGAKHVLAEGWNTNAGNNWTGQDFTTPQADFDLDEVLSYAASKGVNYIAHNETRGFVDYYDQNLERIFSFYEDKGIHAIKTGYATKFNLGGVNRSHYDQEAVRHYQRVIDAAAAHGITVNAHEAIKPTGLNRTYPNMMSGEGVAGMEMQNYMGANGNPPAQATILPFTRFMGGPADYTPGVLNVTWDPAALNTRVQTTLTTQLALYTTFYSPLQMLADTPENYALFPEAFDYLQGMPATWDESEVEAVIGDSTVTARRSGTSWYVGAITDENDRNLRIPLDFLDPGTTYVAEIYSDTADTTWRGNPLPMDKDEALVTSATTVTAALVAGGGQAMRIRPATPEQQAALEAYDAPAAELVGDPQISLDARSRTVVVDATVRNTGSTVGQAVFTVDGGSATAATRVGPGEERTVTLRLAADALPFPGTSTLSVGDGLGTVTDSVDVDLLPEVDAADRTALQELVAAGGLDPERADAARKYLARAENRQARGDFVGTQRAMQGLRLLADRSSRTGVSPAAGTAISGLTEPFVGEATGLFAALRALRELEGSGEVDAEAVASLRTTLAGAATSAVTGADGAARTAVGQAATQATGLAGSGPALTALRTVLDGLKQADVRLEAESGVKVNGAANTTEHAGYTGTGFVKGLTKVGAAVTVTGNLGAAIDYDVSVRFGNGMTVAPLDRQLTLLLNDLPGAKVQFANQGQDADRWKRWAVSQAGTFRLRAGSNTATLAWVGDDTGNVNVDHVLLRPSLGTLADAAVDDLTAPVVSTGLSPQPADVWSPVPVTVTAGATDGADPAPVSEVRVDEGPWAPYDGPVVVDQDGLHTVAVRSIDAAGNLAEPTVHTIGVDPSAPSLAFDFDDRTRSVALVTEDEVSEVATTEYRADAGEWLPYTAAVALPRGTASVLQARATDLAGNRTTALLRVPAVGEPEPEPEPQPEPQPSRITARLAARSAGARDVLRVLAPSAARGATVRLYEKRGGRRVLLASRRADGFGDARFVVRDPSRSKRRYWAEVSATDRTRAARTPTRVVR